MVRKGCTACYDLVAEIPAPSVEGIDAVARAYHDVGMRAVIAPMMADASFYRAIPGLLDAMPPELRERAEAVRLQPFDVSLATCRKLLDELVVGPRPAAAGARAHHPAPLQRRRSSSAAATSRSEHGIGVQMHRRGIEGAGRGRPKRYGTTLVGHLHKLGLLAPNFTAAHAIWLDDDDIARLADAGACGRAQSRQQPQARLGAGGDTAVARPRHRLRHRHRRLPVVRQPQHVRGDAAGGVRLARAGPRSARMAVSRRSVRGRHDRRRPRARPGEAASAGSRPGSRPTWCSSISPASITCRSTIRCSTSCSARTAPASTGS